MDKRVIKTKTNLKNTLVAMLKEKPFEKIEVTELCKRANASRITFYMYYGDKYDLLHELYEDMNDEMYAYYSELQQTDNREDDPFKSYQNLGKAIIHKYKEHMDFYQNVKMDGSKDLLFSYFDFSLKYLEDFEEKYRNQLKPVYPPKQVVVTLMLGFWGFIYTGYYEGVDPDKLESDTMKMINSMIQANLFERKQ